MLVIAMLAVHPTMAEDADQPVGQWTRHTIDDRSRGADGVRLGDVNGDGLMDIVTGWEEGGVVKLYVNPGPDEVKQAWPAVVVGRVGNVEDAVLVDLDGDGAVDVVSCCEGRTRTVYVHWGPADQARLLDAQAWVTEAVPATTGLQMWMYCLPMQVDGQRGVDLVVGSKERGAAVGWLESPADPRDLGAWTYHKVSDAGWIMSLERAAGDGPGRVLVTDRKGPTRGVYLLEVPGWTRTDLELGKAEYMFAAQAPDGLGGLAPGWAVATRDGVLRLYIESRDGEVLKFDVVDVPWPFGVKHGKAVAVGRVDADAHEDLVLTTNIQGQDHLPSVTWVRVDPTTPPQQWQRFDIGGPAGTKFDRIELIDLDGDGDLDVLTCEEIDQLGVFWYENPYAVESR